jgi:HEAT repeat protein
MRNLSWGELGALRDHIDGLIRELRVNDGKDAWEYEEPPREPEEAMRSLMEVGEEAVEPLIKLLENPSKYSCLYAIKVLGEIGSPKAVKPIMDAFFSESFDDAFPILDEYNQPIIALQKIGPSALEPALDYLKKSKEEESRFGIDKALSIIVKFRDERSFTALIDALSHPDDYVKEVAVDLLKEYGDTRAVEHLKKLLEHDDWRKYVASAIRKLVTKEIYRSLIAPHAIKQIESSRNEILENLQQIQYAHEYRKHYEGDEAEKLTNIELEQREQIICESIKNLLMECADLAVFEAAISEKEYEKIRDIISRINDRLYDRQEQLWQEYEEEMYIIKGIVPSKVVWKESTRSYRGLVSSRYESNPKLDILCNKVYEWLKDQKFLVTKDDGSMLARKEPKGNRKGFYVHIGIAYDRPRTWGRIHTIIWGEGWNQNEADDFDVRFWKEVENTVEQLVKKLEVHIEEKT